MDMFFYSNININTLRVCGKAILAAVPAQYYVHCCFVKVYVGWLLNQLNIYSDVS